MQCFPSRCESHPIDAAYTACAPLVAKDIPIQISHSTPDKGYYNGFPSLTNARISLVSSHLIRPGTIQTTTHKPPADNHLQLHYLKPLRISAHLSLESHRCPYSPEQVE